MQNDKVADTTKDISKENINQVVQKRSESKNEADKLYYDEGSEVDKDQIKVDVVNDEDVAPYNLCYGIYCLLNLALTLVACIWSRSAMSTFYGFGIGDKINNPDYAMQKSTIGLNASTYAEYSGIWFTLPYIPTLLFGGVITANMPKKALLGWCTIFLGVAVACHGLCNTMFQLYLLSGAMGFVQGASMALTHSLVTEYFAPKYATRAYFAFSISKQVGDSLKYMTPLLINNVGWRLAWIVGGCAIGLNGLLIVFTVVEPKKKDGILLTKNEEKAKEVEKEANIVLKQEKKDGDFEVKEVENKVVLKKKRKTCKDLCSDYKRHFYLMFTNVPAMMLIVGCIFRLFQAMTIQFFLGEYMKVYASDYQTYSEFAAIAAFMGGPISTFISGYIVDTFGKRTEMIIPIICVTKSLISIPIGMLMFYQQQSFFLAMVGIYLEVTIGRGWGSSATFMLRNVVDPEIAYLGVSLFLILMCLQTMVTAEVLAWFVNTYDLSPLTTPREYGNLVTSCCVFPLLLSAPFFLYSGFVMRRMKREKMADTEDENKKASIYIKSGIGPDETGVVQGLRENLQAELKSLKVSVKHKMSYGIGALNKSDLPEKNDEEQTKNKQLIYPVMK